MEQEEAWPETLKRIRSKFSNGAGKWWWGDYLDGRFLLARWVRENIRGPVLDIGCGPGVILSEVNRGTPKAGIDIDREALKAASSFNPGAFLAAADWKRLPFKDKSFSGVVLSGVLCGSLPREVKESVLAETVRVLKPGGRVLIFDINREHWAAGRFNQLLLDYGGLGTLLGDHGIAIRNTVGWNPLPSFVWFLPRSLKARIAAKNHRYKYFFIPSIILSSLPGLPYLLYRLGRTPLFRSKAKSFIVSADYMEN